MSPALPIPIALLKVRHRRQ